MSPLIQIIRGIMKKRGNDLQPSHQKPGTRRSAAAKCRIHDFRVNSSEDSQCLRGRARFAEQRAPVKLEHQQ
jgi:hypothetical protein